MVSLCLPKATQLLAASPPPFPPTPTHTSRLSCAGYYVICSLGDANDPSGNNPHGAIGIFDAASDELVSTLDIADLLSVDGFDHPHDAVFLPNGDLVFCTWGTARIAYFRRLV